MKTWKERTKQVFPKNVFQLREALYNELDWFIIPYSDDQKLFKDIEIFDFESICVQEDKFCDNDATRWISEHVPTSERE